MAPLSEAGRGKYQLQICERIDCHMVLRRRQCYFVSGGSVLRTVFTPCSDERPALFLELVINYMARTCKDRRTRGRWPVL